MLMLLAIFLITVGLTENYGRGQVGLYSILVEPSRQE